MKVKTISHKIKTELMKQLLTSAFLFVFCLFSFGQNLLVNVSGHVENTDGTPAPGIDIQITTDSTAFWPGYSNVVQTDENGNYTDSFEALSQGAVWVSMADCNNTYQTIQAYWSPATTTIEIDFVYCDPSDDCSVDIVLDSLQGAGQGLYAAVAYNGSISYQWNTGELTQDIVVTESGTYCVTIMDAEGCTDSDCITIDLGSANCHVVVLNNPTGLHASGQGAAPFSYLWNTGETTAIIAPQSNGTYCVTLTDAEGCSSSDCIWYGSQQDSTCHVIITHGQATDPDVLGAIASGTAPFTYAWSTGAATSTIDGSIPGTYCVSITDATGCQAEACYTVVSNDPDNFEISGLLFLADSNLVVPLEGRVYLFSIEQNNLVTLVDSTDFAATPIGAAYTFGQVQTGNYIVLATLSPDSPEFENYLPTYYGGVLFWDEATIINIPYAGWASFDIFFIEGNIPQGPGFIGGSVEDMGFTGNNPDDRDDPLINATILLLNELDEPLGHTKTNDEGTFEFANLAWGTYKVYLEIPGIEQQFVAVTIGPENPEVRDIVFEIEDGTVTNISELELANQITVFPNPARTLIQVKIEMASVGNTNLTILDLNGNPLAMHQFNANGSTQKESIDVSKLAPGIYFLSLEQAGNRTTVRFVKN